MNCLHSLTSCSLISTACVRCRRHPCRLFLPLVGAHSVEVNFFLKQKSLALQMFLLQSKGFSLEMGRVELSPFAHFLFAHCDRLRSLTAASLPPFPPAGRRSLRGVQLLFKTKIPCFTNVYFAKQGFLFGDGES